MLGPHLRSGAATIRTMNPEDPADGFTAHGTVHHIVTAGPIGMTHHRLVQP
jgi:hypothetical protein